MADHNRLGTRGEELAIAHLIYTGFEILEKNWRFGKAEIDIIARKGNVLLVVEVKTRGSDLFENPEEAVNNHKIKRIIEAADHYVIEKDLEVEVRFDIIAIQNIGGEWEVNHIEDAFQSF